MRQKLSALIVASFLVISIHILATPGHEGKPSLLEIIASGSPAEQPVQDNDPSLIQPTEGYEAGSLEESYKNRVVLVGEDCLEPNPHGSYILLEGDLMADPIDVDTLRCVKTNS